MSVSLHFISRSSNVTRNKWKIDTKLDKIFRFISADVYFGFGLSSFCLLFFVFAFGRLRLFDQKLNQIK